MANFRAKVLLPQSSTRKSYPEYEEVVIDKMAKTELIPENQLITINDNFEPFARVAFENCKKLNPMQTYVFETAYRTNKNMLVAAPTGAGKTNVAMMAVLNELRNYFKPGTTEMIASNTSEKFKIIYIAPMKSLATEQTENFKTRLKKLGIKTRELTGDMSMTADEISKTHIIVTTPEKWDVVTRKSKGDVDMLSLVRLLIIDEVHLLQSDRGPVLEAIVARTLRYVESSQRMTRIVGLSATLPNYIDVATFLRVNPNEGLFYFDDRFRPVPLTQTFIGVRPVETNAQARAMDRICYNIILQHMIQSKQVMIFVHARNSTQKVAGKLRELIQLNNKVELFQPDLAEHPEAAKLMTTAKNQLLKNLFDIGFGIHHAGMIRQDRLLVERLFRDGVIKVLVCTATLAWGVNFPAHAVVIRGTEIYDASAGKFVDVGLLDVMQIFGRAGRPQYDTDGNAIILTALDKMDSYLKLLTNQTPIESNFVKYLTDNLNAEVVSGTVSNVSEAMEWLRYTYLNVRMSKNPLAYGCEQLELDLDPTLACVRNRLITTAARELDEAHMCRFNQQTGKLESTDLGRIASHYYINHATVARYNEILGDNLQTHDIFGLIGEAQEFQQLKYREEEAHELDKLRSACHLPLAGGVIESTKGKVSCLLQAYISRSFITSHSLISDLLYIAQNAARIARGLFEYSLKRGWPVTTLNLLKVCKMLELQTWDFHSPFRHFDLPPQVVMHLEESGIPVEQIETMSVAEVAKVVNYPDRMGTTIKDYLSQLPYVIVDGEVKPIKSNLLTLNLKIKPYFKWNDRFHGHKRQVFWLWIVDEEITEQIYHSEHIKFSKDQVQKQQPQYLSINIPLVDDTLEDGSMGQRIPSEYIVHILSDQWTGCDYEFPIDCRKVTLPVESTAFTRIPPNLNQLPLSALQNDLNALIFRPAEQKTTSNGISYDDRHMIMSGTPLHVETFNTIQSQVFFSLYRCDKNVLVCSPPGSGKTLLSDFAILRAFNGKNVTHTKNKVIYITPIESLAQIQYYDWKSRLGNSLQKQVTHLNDKTLFNESNYDRCDILVTSAEKFFIWLTRANASENLQRVALIVLDDLHLLSDKRGLHLELTISKLNYLKSVNRKIRFRYLGLSNTVSNAQDLAGWLSVKKYNAYNFHQATSRPIQLEIHISSYAERHYSPRMATMNKPIFKAIQTHSFSDPSIIFVSSKKQCSTTALDLILCLVHDAQSSEKQWLHMDQSDLDALSPRVQDDDLKLSLEFGIGLLFPSMKFSDKKIVEELYSFNKIQILISTANYAWESNLRGHLIIVKGTERYDSNIQRFVDYPPADVMQMLGKAGRPNIDSTGVSILMIRDIYKEFYKKFLHESFPVESSLNESDDVYLRNFLTSDYKVTVEAPDKVEENNGHEVKQSDVIRNRRSNQKDSNKLMMLEVKRHAMKMYSSTFLVRRLGKNPSYYGINDGKTPECFLSKFLDEKKSLYENIKN